MPLLACQEIRKKARFNKILEFRPINLPYENN